MNIKLGLSTLVLGIFIALDAGTINYFNEASDFTLDCGIKFKPEMFFGKNISLLNNCNEADKIVFVRQTFDLNFISSYGVKTFGCSIIDFKFDLRNKVIWGDPNSIATTTESDIKEGATVFGSHRHNLNRLIPWMREIWLKVDFGELLGVQFRNRHALTLGLFPFELGRGIALGSAYAVGPEILGFYTDYAIDQFAPGAKLSGEFIKDKLMYDFYVALLQNKSASLGQTGEEIYGQEYGRLNNPERGFGKINFLVAAHTFVRPFNNDIWGKLTLEPYFLYNHDTEQKVQFLGDAESRLLTLGLAGEYIGRKTEFGFDYAFNLGNQRVKGWDRNSVIRAAKNSFIQEFNSHVVNQDGVLIPFIAGSSAELIIDGSIQSASQNGKQIGVVNTDFGGLTAPVDLINAPNRFRDPYINIYRGWMFVADAAYWIRPKELGITATAGVASGDENPNYTTKDGTYDGFIGLQEIYSGKRVKSAFLLGGAGKLKRPMSAPTDLQSPTRFSSVTSGFTNLVFTGTAMFWKPKCRGRESSINPNILFYWQEKPTHAFDLFTRKDSHQLARTFLGAEINTFASCYLIKDLKGFVVWSIFIPGGHYDDIRGKPLNRKQQKALEKLNRTGLNGPVPNIGSDIAYTFNIGLEYGF